jgi:hypothetical protein
VSNTRGQPTVGPATGSGQDYATGSGQEYGARSSAGYAASEQGRYPAGEQYGYGYQDDTSTGSVAGMVLAGVLMMVGGALTFLNGLGVIIHRGFYNTVNANYPYHWNITSWGWTHVALGGVVFLAGICVLLGMVWARVVGVILATLSAVASFLFIPYYPVWSIILIAIDVYIIWALIKGGRRERA